MKKIILGFLFLVSIFFVAGCSTKEDNTNFKNQISDLESQISDLKSQVENLQKENQTLKNELEEANSRLLEAGAYTITVTDIDEEILGNEVVFLDSYESLWNALDELFDVAATVSDYGHYISSINGSIIDSNYYMAIYENGTLASTGVDELIPDAGDQFEFKVECFNTIESGYGTFDEYDILVDKIIYYYAKNYIPDFLNNQTSYTSTSYWDMMYLNMMISNGYDISLFNTNNLTSTFKNSILNVDINTLSGVNIGKYYYSSRLLNNDLTSFKTFYENYITSAISTTYNEYTMPFIMSPAYSLNVTSEKLTELINTTYKASTNFGIDALTWQITSLQLFNKYDKEILTEFTAKDYGNATSTALALLPYAAFNINVRDQAYNIDNKDLIEILIDNYYDEELCLIKVNKKDTDVNYSTNQIYASLMTYKVQRDKGKAINIFA